MIALLVISPFEGIWQGHEELRAAAGEAGTSESQTRHGLTIDETLGSVFLRPIEGGIRHLFKNSNPLAKGQLYEILSEPEHSEYHASLVCILGYIGDGDDAKRLEGIVRSRYSGVLSKPEKNTICVLFVSLGVMARRDVAEAKQVLDRMMTLSYWADVKFRYYPPKHTARPPFEYESVARVTRGFAIAETGELRARIEKILDSIADPERKKYMEYRLDLTSLADYVREFKADEAVRITPELRAICRKLGQKYLGKAPPPAKPKDKPVSNRTLHEGISNGAPEVLPTLIDRLIRHASEGRSAIKRPADIAVAIIGAERFRIEEAVPVLTRIYSDAEVSRELRYHALHAIAWINAPSAKAVLTDALQDETLPVGWRCWVAFALVGQDADVGREFLLRVYEQDLQRIRNKDGPRQMPHDVMARLDDLWMFDRLIELRNAETHDVARKNLENRIERVEVNRLALKELVSRAQDSNWPQNLYRRCPALQALRWRGNLETIPLVQALQPSACDIQRDDVQQQLRTQNANLDRLKREVIAEIRQRHWRDMPNTQETLDACRRLADLGDAPVFAKDAPLKPQRTPALDAESSRQLANDARKQFDAIRARIEEGEFETIRERLLEDGRVMDAERMRMGIPEFIKDLRFEQRVLESLGDKQLVFLDAKWIQEGTPRQDGDVEVRFKVAESAKISEHLFRNRGSRLTVAADGSLVVLMKRSKGKWYWNPFGW